eukprot:scaffold508_cov554-Prasinococcus_capsulatus_cf.AAC.3
MVYTVCLGLALLAFRASPVGVGWLQTAAVFMIGFFLYGPQMLVGLCGAEIVGLGVGPGGECLCRCERGLSRLGGLLRGCQCGDSFVHPCEAIWMGCILRIIDRCLHLGVGPVGAYGQYEEFCSARKLAELTIGAC